MEKSSPEDFGEILKNHRFNPFFHPPEPEILVKTLPRGMALCTQSLSFRALTADPFRPDLIFHFLRNFGSIILQRPIILPLRGSLEKEEITKQPRAKLNIVSKRFRI